MPEETQAFDWEAKLSKTPTTSDVTEKFAQFFDRIEDPKIKNIVEEAKSVSPKQRVEKLKELGILTDLEGFDWGNQGGDRFYVFGNVNGAPIPFYISSAHTDGKRKDLKFFNFFGVQYPKNGSPWLIKGDIPKDTNQFWGHPELETISKILTQVFDFDTDRIKKSFVPPKGMPSNSWEKFKYEKTVENFAPNGHKITSDTQLNQILSSRFGIDFEEINNLPRSDWQAAKIASDKVFSEAF
jgi:hypothetical protein